MVAPFAREDESDDRRFYAVPRLVVHIDDGAIAAIGALYRELLPPRGRVLDLMSSWRSHLPPDQSVRLYGLGLNAVELAENAQLRGAVLAHLNRTPVLPFASTSCLRRSTASEGACRAAPSATRPRRS